MLKALPRLAMALLLAGSSSEALAQSAQWTLSEASGDVTVARGTVRVKATRGMVLGIGEAVVTGANGRAVLVHAKDFVTVAANSRVRLPQEAKAAALTRFFQDMGNAIFRIQKLGKPHFAVDTPYLAAVVKGTTFSITVGPRDTSLQVTEGVVEVATIDGGARELVLPGAIAMIAAGDRYRLSISGDQPRIIDSPLRQADTSSPVPSPPTVPAVVQSTAEPVAEPSAAAPKDSPSLATGQSDADVLDVAVSSKPVDMGQVTGGLITGASPVAFLVAATQPPRKTEDGQTVANSPPPSTPPVSEAAPAAKGIEQPGEKVTGQPDKGDGHGQGEPKDEPGKGDTPGQNDKAGKGSDSDPQSTPGKDDKSEKDEPSDKPDKDSVPGKVEPGDEPGKDDKSGKDEPSNKPDKGDAPGKDAPGDDTGKDDMSEEAEPSDKADKDDPPGKGEPGVEPGKEDKPGNEGQGSKGGG